MATALFAALGTAAWQAAAWLFVAANFGFGTSILFYESLLPGLAQGRELDRLSTRAYGLGYAGGGLLLVVNLLLVMRPHWFGLPGAGVAVRASFVSVAVWWAVFSIPLLRHVPEPLAGRGPAGPRAALRRLAGTCRGDPPLPPAEPAAGWPTGSTTTASAPSSRWPRPTARRSASG